MRDLVAEVGKAIYGGESAEAVESEIRLKEIEEA